MPFWNQLLMQCEGTLLMVTAISFILPRGHFHNVVGEQILGFMLCFVLIQKNNNKKTPFFKLTSSNVNISSPSCSTNRELHFMETFHGIFFVVFFS